MASSLCAWAAYCICCWLSRPTWLGAACSAAWSAGLGSLLGVACEQDLKGQDSVGCHAHEAERRMSESMRVCSVRQSGGCANAALDLLTFLLLPKALLAASVSVFLRRLALCRCRRALQLRLSPSNSDSTWNRPHCWQKRCLLPSLTTLWILRWNSQILYRW